MIELEHLLPEPTALRDHRRSNPAGSWEDFKFQQTRHVVRRQLNQEQAGLCVYCENLLDPNAGHVEHIKPKQKNPDLTFEYPNLAHSCDGMARAGNSARHCGPFKDNETLPVEPRPGCNTCFSISTLDGKLTATSGPASAMADASKTLKILGLNDPALTWTRKSYLDAISQLEPSQKPIFLADTPFRWVLRGI